MNQTPFAFMGSQDSGWDPTLGGTFSVQHHWDFTDQNTMTFGGTGVSGSEVASITDKVGSIPFTPVDGPSGNALKITSTGSFDVTEGATFLSGSPYQYQNSGNYNWMPNTMATNQDFSVVMIAKNQRWEEYGTSWPRSLWYVRSNATNGYDNLNMFMLYQQSWIALNCSGSGDYRWGLGVYQTGWTAYANYYNSAPDSILTAPSVYGMSHDHVPNDYLFQRNNETACTFNRDTSQTSAGEGLTIGGAPIGFNEKNCFEGWAYHFVVYDETLTSDNLDSIYSNWNTFFNG
jgi:hypothetical protein